MYEYKGNPTGMGAVQEGNVEIFGKGIAVSPALPPTPYPGIRKADVGIFGTGIAVSPAQPPSPFCGIEQCATGNCGCAPAMGNAGNGAGGSPWWPYAALGAAVGGALYLLHRRGVMRRNPEEELTPAEVVKQAAAISIQACLPTILWGPPGIGKTQWVNGLAKAMAPMNKDGEPLEVFTLIGSTKDPTDIGGMPMTDGSVRPPKWAQHLRARSENGLRSILFLDEFSSMSPMVHAALLRVVNEKVAGEAPAGDFDPVDGPLKGHAVHILAAANRPKHGASSKDLPPPAANRMVHFSWPSPTAAEWADGMLFGWKSPFYYTLAEDWRDDPLHRVAIERIGTFLRHRDSPPNTPMLFAMPPLDAKDDEGNRMTGGAWPSPRSWDIATQLYAATLIAEGPDKKQGAPKEVQITAVAGAVGNAASGQLFAFGKYKDLPDPEEVLAHPHSWKVPTDTVRLFIISNTLVNAVKSRPTVDRFSAAWEGFKHAIDETDDVPTLTPAARDLAAMLKDNRYKKALQGAPTPKATVKRFGPAFKKMKLYP